MSVPDEAVEAAARAYQVELSYTGAPHWDDLTEERRQLRLEWARQVLTAAAPFIAAQAWDEGHGHCFHVENPDRKDRNPYRISE